jgi:hypothetical protein
VLVNLLQGNELFRTFFAVNDAIVGYWTSHLLLAFFTSFLPAWLAEKLFLTCYVLAMVFAFRYLIKGIQPAKGNFILFLIFPFVYHSFILLGYYAFSLAIPLFFLILGLFVRQQDRFALSGLSWKFVILFAILLLLLFLTHALVYLFFGFSFLIFYTGRSVSVARREKGRFRSDIWWLSSMKLVLAALPSFILWLLYIRTVLSVDGTVEGTAYSMRELTGYLLRIRQLVGFHHEMESLGYIPLFLLLTTLALVALVKYAGELRRGSEKLNGLPGQHHIWLIIATGFLGLYFFAPERISAGSLTNRFGLFFFLMLVVWLSVQKFQRFFQIVTVLVLLFSVSYTRVVHHRFYVNLNRDIDDIMELTQYMEPNAVVDYRLASDNWVHLHFQLYAAVDKPLVHIRNSQCQGQFPMVWNEDALPRCYAGEKPVRPSGSAAAGGDRLRMEVDYITIFFYDNFWSDSSEAEWHKILTEDYREIHKGKNGRAALYGKKHPDKTSLPAP